MLLIHLIQVIVIDWVAFMDRMRKEQVEEEMVTSALEQPEACSLQRANQNVVILEAQLKEMTPSLDAIAE